MVVNQMFMIQVLRIHSLPFIRNDVPPQQASPFRNFGRHPPLTRIAVETHCGGDRDHLTSDSPDRFAILGGMEEVVSPKEDKLSQLKRVAAVMNLVAGLSHLHKLEKRITRLWPMVFNGSLLEWMLTWHEGAKAIVSDQYNPCCEM
jgi:hypothetical protein